MIHHGKHAEYISPRERRRHEKIDIIALAHLARLSARLRDVCNNADLLRQQQCLQDGWENEEEGEYKGGEWGTQLLNCVSVCFLRKSGHAQYV